MSNQPLFNSAFPNALHLFIRLPLTHEWRTHHHLFCASVRISIWMMRSYSGICGRIDGHHLDVHFQRLFSSSLRVVFNRLFVGAQQNAQAIANYVHKAYCKWWLWRKRFWHWKWLHESLHGCSVNKAIFIFSWQKGWAVIKSKSCWCIWIIVEECVSYL